MADRVPLQCVVHNFQSHGTAGTEHQGSANEITVNHDGAKELIRPRHRHLQHEAAEGVCRNDEDPHKPDQAEENVSSAGQLFQDILHTGNLTSVCSQRREAT